MSRVAAVRMAAWLVLGFLVLPMLVVVPVSLTDQRFLSLPEERVSLQHYRALWENALWSGAILRSFLCAAAATLLALALGVPSAVAFWRIASRLGEVLRILVLLPIVVPGIVSAVALYRHLARLGLVDTYAGVVLAHTLTSLPFVMIAASASLANMDARLERAARGLGAGRWQTLWWVTLPQIRPGILAGAALAFVSAWDETVVTLFITGLNVYLLPRAIWDGIRDNVDPAIAAVATLMILATALGLLAEGWLRRRRGPQP
ncbi:ABC transporter permease [Roseomonas sp. OT10]|uniref:ABC transporter permease n=1 Tax=Roseomonas cutis TaxID=2897332 RepID=UPI001E4DE928|nr:ABC transporter permease [Roseomonas sp. OT10]UFN48515.1 ABC transporter permease [Roseomonas sp. OT10]